MATQLGGFARLRRLGGIIAFAVVLHPGGIRLGGGILVIILLIIIILSSMLVLHMIHHL